MSMALFRKEWKELIHSSILWRLFVIVLFIGIIVPLEVPRSAPTAMDVVIYAFFSPGFFGFQVTADMIAGEKERETFNSLLSTPISRNSIYITKAIAASTISALCSWLAFAVFWVVITFGNIPLQLNVRLTVMVLCMSILVALGISLLGILISWKSPDVRTAQATTTIPILIMGFGTPYLILHAIPRSDLVKILNYPYGELFVVVSLCVAILDILIGIFSWLLIKD